MKKKTNLALEIWERYNYQTVPETEAQAVFEELNGNLTESGRRSLLDFIDGRKPVNGNSMMIVLKNLALSRLGMAV